jgi:hypothetical protein
VAGSGLGRIFNSSPTLHPLSTSEVLAMHLESAEYLREGISWLLMALRRAIRQFASREVCDEKRLLKGGVGRVKRLGDPEKF